MSWPTLTHKYHPINDKKDMIHSTRLKQIWTMNDLNESRQENVFFQFNSRICCSSVFYYKSQFIEFTSMLQSINCLKLLQTFNIFIKYSHQNNLQKHNIICNSYLWPFHGQRRAFVKCHVNAKLMRNTCHQLHT